MRWDDVFYKWNIRGLCIGQCLEMGRHVLQVEHQRFMYRTVSRDGMTCSTSGTSEVYVQDSV